MWRLKIKLGGGGVVRQCWELKRIMKRESLGKGRRCTAGLFSCGIVTAGEDCFIRIFRLNSLNLESAALICR